jgi:hypothetical protein
MNSKLKIRDMCIFDVWQEGNLKMVKMAEGKVFCVNNGYEYAHDLDQEFEVIGRMGIFMNPTIRPEFQLETDSE